MPVRRPSSLSWVSFSQTMEAIDKVTQLQEEGLLMSYKRHQQSVVIYFLKILFSH